MRRSKRNYQLASVAAGACLGVTLGATANLQAQTAPDTSSQGDKISNLEQENQKLQKRLDALENLVQKQGISPSATSNAAPAVSAMSDFGITGFVTTSFFHDTSEPQGNSHTIPGYLWNTHNDSLSINKIKLTFASPPVQASGDKFDVAYRVSFIAGQDAPIVNSSASTIGFQYLREAYLELNVPIGSGLNVRAGELISLLNYESGDGGAVNANFSQGFQWFFTGNGPSTAVQLGYDFTDQIGLKARIQNGLYAGPIDNNSSKTVVASLNLKPLKGVWMNLIGFAGREDVGFAQTVVGGSVLGGWQATGQLGFGTEIDYFDFYNSQASASVATRGDCPVYSFGLWTTYDFTKEWELALRTEFLSDRRGDDMSGGALAGGSFTPGALGLLNPPGTGQDITSVALTLDYKPLPRIKLQPEIRYDHTSWSHGWDPSTLTPAGTSFSKQNRFIIGVGASYIF